MIGGQAGVALPQPTALGDAVGLVVEPLGEQIVKIRHDRGFQKLGMQLGNAVHRMASDDGQMGHADMGSCPSSKMDIRRNRSMSPGYGSATSFRNRALISWMICRCRGKSRPKRPTGPLFQGLGQKGVVGIGEDGLGHVPGLFPFHALLVHEIAHELGDGDGGMGVVELDGRASGSLRMFSCSRLKRRRMS